MMRNTAITGYFTRYTLRGLHKSALLAGTVLCSMLFMSAIQAQTLSDDADIIFDANGRILTPEPLTTLAPGIKLTPEEMSGQRIDAEDTGKPAREARENLPQTTVEGRSRIAFNADPMAAQGIRAGNFILRPSLDQGIRATNNADNSADGSSAVLSETTLRLNARSDWARHLATLDASGIILKTLSGEHVSEPRGQIDAALSLDLNHDTRLNLGLAYAVNREDASDPNGISSARTRPLVQYSIAQAGLERDMGKIFASAIARVNNTRYGKAELFNGDKLDQSERNNTYVSMTLRGGFELSAIIRPFAEVEIGRRLYENIGDLNRNAMQFGLRSGLQINRGEKFNGEFSLGYIGARSEDDRLRNTGGFSADAAMNWSPQRGTDVQLGLRTFLDSSPDIGGNSSLLYLANINVTRMINSKLSLNARIDTSIRNNLNGSGTDYGMGAEIGATYWFNRFFGVDTKLRHQFMNSDVESRKYTANSIYAGVKLRR